MRLALAIAAAGLVGLLLPTWYHPHYAAPMAGALLAVSVLSLQRLSDLRLRGLRAGALLAAAVATAALASSVLSVRDAVRNPRRSWAEDRARIASQLEGMGGRHLVLVRLSPEHPPDHEWAYNAADIGGSTIVWARSATPEEDAELLSAFRDRAAWSVAADAPAPRLTRLPILHRSR
jgi:hypothetical protein